MKVSTESSCSLLLTARMIFLGLMTGEILLLEIDHDKQGKRGARAALKGSLWTTRNVRSNGQGSGRGSCGFDGRREAIDGKKNSSRYPCGNTETRRGQPSRAVRLPLKSG